MEKNHLIAAIAHKTGFAPADVRTVLRALHEVAMADEPLDTAGDGHEIARFWICITASMEQGRLTEGVHVRTDQGTIAIRWGACYKAYAAIHKTKFGRDANSSTFELALLKRSPAFMAMKPSYWIGTTKTSALLFDRALIPVT